MVAGKFQGEQEQCRRQDHNAEILDFRPEQFRRQISPHEFQ